MYWETRCSLQYPMEEGDESDHLAWEWYNAMLPSSTILICEQVPSNTAILYELYRKG